ncbi:hypothetical protein [Brevundimonas sp.]|uniref:hypothetical protein n=1 Tax=Brevundimonas sp. TaxID=1871086 RepID=UPI003D0B005E
MRRINYSRLQQADLALLAMQIAASKGGSVMTSDLKELLVQKFKPTGMDAATNANWQMNFEQVVGNLISNRGMPNSMFNKGYATRIVGGFELTALGQTFVESAPH